MALIEFLIHAVLKVEATSIDSTNTTQPTFILEHTLINIVFGVDGGVLLVFFTVWREHDD
jgi:hypothetical protein